MVQKKINKNMKGFTLVEIMVSVSIFAVVMLMVSSSVYAVFDSNKKSQTLRSVMDNLNLSLEAMTRTIRFGKDYHCDINTGVQSSPRDCAGGASSIAITDFNGNRVVYKLVGTRIARTINGGADQYVTGTDVNISTTTFRVIGSTPYSPSTGTYDLSQAKVIIVVDGYAGVKSTSRSNFVLQTTVSQRQFDTQ